MPSGLMKHRTPSILKLAGFRRRNDGCDCDHELKPATQSTATRDDVTLERILRVERRHCQAQQIVSAIPQ